MNMKQRKEIKEFCKAFTEHELAADKARWGRRKQKEQKEIDDFNAECWASVQEGPSFLGNDNHNIG
tara:strand:- start:29 stop:226 length:198 start_codon:yes stop_codon:yes gene_type:complete